LRECEEIKNEIAKQCQLSLSQSSLWKVEIEIDWNSFSRSQKNKLNLYTTLRDFAMPEIINAIAAINKSKFATVLQDKLNRIRIFNVSGDDISKKKLNIFARTIYYDGVFEKQRDGCIGEEEICSYLNRYAEAESTRYIGM
jgi:hypothetical protein